MSQLYRGILKRRGKHIREVMHHQMCLQTKGKRPGPCSLAELRTPRSQIMFFVGRSHICRSNRTEPNRTSTLNTQKTLSFIQLSLSDKDVCHNFFIYSYFFDVLSLKIVITFFVKQCPTICNKTKISCSFF